MSADWIRSGYSTLEYYLKDAGEKQHYEFYTDNEGNKIDERWNPDGKTPNEIKAFKTYRLLLKAMATLHREFGLQHCGDKTRLFDPTMTRKVRRLEKLILTLSTLTNAAKIEPHAADDDMMSREPK